MTEQAQANSAKKETKENKTITIIGIAVIGLVSLVIFYWMVNSMMQSFSADKISSGEAAMSAESPAANMQMTAPPTTRAPSENVPVPTQNAPTRAEPTGSPYAPIGSDGKPLNGHQKFGR